MAFDEDLAERVRAALGQVRGVTEIKMFGGLCYTVGGNMATGIVKDELMVRLSYEAGDAALEEPHVRPMDFTGKPMRGFLFVAPEGIRTAKQLQGWIDRGVAYASTLPPKKPKPKTPRTPA
ncbi:MAG: TfoX/Sxy family protein [Actinomycetota bacterium]